LRDKALEATTQIMTVFAAFILTLLKLIVQIWEKLNLCLFNK